VVIDAHVPAKLDPEHQSPKYKAIIYCPLPLPLLTIKLLRSLDHGHGGFVVIMQYHHLAWWTCVDVMGACVIGRHGQAGKEAVAVSLA
jgi:hypothetical protein